MRTLPRILVLFLLSFVGCEELGAVATQPTTVADAGTNPDNGQVTTPDTQLSPDKDTPVPEETKPDPCTLCSADQICQAGACIAKPDPCADWNWMKQYQWKCPGWYDADIKLKLVPKQNACWVSAKNLDPMPVSDLICNKEKKEFSYFNPQANDTMYCVPIE